MFVCKDCGQTFDTPVKFCNKCGSSSIAPAEVYSSGPVYGTPVTPSAPTSPAGKILGIISMVTGIVGLVFGIISFFMSFGGFVDGDIAVMAMVYSIMFAVFGVAAMVLGGMSRNKGFTGNMANIGKIFGLVAVILCATAFFFSFIGICVNA